MPNIICIGSDIKAGILDRISSRDLSAQIQRIPECKLPDDIQLDLAKGSRKGRREKGEKRAPSPYNIFIGTCMKAKKIKGFGNAAPAMKECAAAWRKQK